MRFVWTIVVAGWSVVATGQDNPFLTPEERAASSNKSSIGSRFFENEPFDQLTLNDKQRTKLRVFPVDFPGRRLPKSPDPKSLLRVRLLDHNGDPYDVAWGDVAELRLFEQLLLDEAARLGTEGRFDEATDYFIYLRRERPATPGLEEAEIALNFAEAEAALRGEHPDLAYARLLRLEQRAPRDPRLADLAARATQQLAEHYLKTGSPRAAKAVTDRFAKTREKHAVTTALTKAFAQVSAEKLATATKAFADGRFVEAQRDAQTAAVLAPSSSEALDVYRRAVTSYPAAAIGVVETATSAVGGPVPSWAQRRIARLKHIPTFELVLHLGEQPRAAYESVSNRWEANDRDPQAFKIRLGAETTGPSAVDVATTLLTASHGGNRTSSSASLLGALELRVIDPKQFDLRFARILPRPEAVVADVLTSRGIGAVGMRALPVAAPPNAESSDARFVRGDSLGSSAVAEVTERAFADEDESVTALLAGDVDAVDRIAPWQTARLRPRRDLRLVRYAAPSVHLLLFNGENPRLAQPEFRRAIGYAVNREAILRNHLQPERDDLAARVIDGVFPAGRAVDDPLGYAYDAVGGTRPYNPQRAFVLAAMSSRNGAPGDASNRPLVLAHPATLTATRACRRIAEYLGAVGIAVELQAAPADQSPTTPGGADLTYVVTSSVEPLVDAADWFGPGGLVNLDSGALRMALADLGRAESMTAARSALFELQRVLHDEALVVPLWQFSEHAVHRSRLVRPTDVAPTSFYQQFERWQVLPQYSEALP